MKLAKRTVNRLKAQYGDWVLITGATSGIGRAIAEELGKAGFSLVLTGRREGLLEQLKSQLQNEFGTETLCLPGDLSIIEDVSALIAATANIPIGIAVLNAGFGTSGKFTAANLEEEFNMLSVNCKAVLALSHHFTQRFSNENRRGAIVFMSSMVGFQGVPNAAHYAATKAYVQSLGEGIARELKPNGIDVLCAAPGPVQSGFASRANMKMGKALSPTQVAIPIIRSIGRKSTVLPGFLTKFLVYNLRMTPRSIKIRIMEKVMAGFTKHQKSTS